MKNSESQTSKTQSLYVPLLVLLMSVAVVVAIAGAVAKNITKKPAPDVAETTAEPKKDEDAFAFGKDGKDTEEDSAKDTKDTKDALKNDSDETKAPDTTADTEAPKTPTVKEDPLPTFAAPCGGAIMTKYSGTTPVFSLTMEDWRTHGGVDLYASAGSDIRACADGVISEVWDDPMMGKCISVEHSGKAVSVYKNLCDELPAGIEKGAAVKCGDVIAAAGESALAEIADEGHLHFELTVGGKTVDPCDYISFSGDQTYEE